jgi:putative membrane protein
MAKKRTLVLCIDRDDDLGRKARIKGPIIGEEANIRAAESLAIADPEDTDVNSIFSAVSAYNELKKARKDVAVATLTGDLKVGMQSDSILAKQLEEVIEKISPTDAVLVSDGAEDEFILPLIQSRIKISSVRRVIIKQSRNIQSMYYLFLRFLEDEKVLKTFVVPLALALLIWAIGGLLGYSQVGYAILLIIALYFLIRAFKLEDVVRRGGKLVWSEIITGRISLMTFLIAIIIFMAGGFSSFNSIPLPTDPKIPTPSWVYYILSFIENILPFVVVAILVWISGRIFDTYLHEKKIYWRYIILSMWTISIGLILSAALILTLGFLAKPPLTIREIINLDLVSRIGIGLLIAIGGSFAYRYIKATFEKKKEKIAIE